MELSRKHSLVLSSHLKNIQRSFSKKPYLFHFFQYLFKISLMLKRHSTNFMRTKAFLRSGNFFLYNFWYFFSAKDAARRISFRSFLYAKNFMLRLFRAFFCFQSKLKNSIFQKQFFQCEEVVSQGRKSGDV